MLELNGEFVIRCELDLAILIDQMSILHTAKIKRMPLYQLEKQIIDAYCCTLVKEKNCHRLQNCISDGNRVRLTCFRNLLKILKTNQNRQYLKRMQSLIT